MCIINSDKILSRVIHNIYASYTNITLTEQQLDLLRKGKYCGVDIVDTLLHYFQLVIKRKGLVSFKTLSYYFYNLTHYNLLKHKNLYCKLQSLYYDKKIALLLQSIKDSEIKSNFKLVLTSLCANTIFFEQFGSFYVIKGRTLIHYKKEDSNETVKNKIVNLTSKYYEKNKILSLDEIKEMVIDLNNSFSMHTKFINIYLFGSYAKGNPTESSDVDLMCIIKKSKFTSQVLSTYISYFFKNKYNRTVDAVVNFNNKNLDNFDKNVLTYAKKLF